MPPKAVASVTVTKPQKSGDGAGKGGGATKGGATTGGATKGGANTGGASKGGSSKGGAIKGGTLTAGTAKGGEKAARSPMAGSVVEKRLKEEEKKKATEEAAKLAAEQAEKNKHEAFLRAREDKRMQLANSHTDHVRRRREDELQVQLERNELRVSPVRQMKTPEARDKVGRANVPAPCELRSHSVACLCHRDAFSAPAGVRLIPIHSQCTAPRARTSVVRGQDAHCVRAGRRGECAASQIADVSIIPGSLACAHWQAQENARKRLAREEKEKGVSWPYKMRLHAAAMTGDREVAEVFLQEDQEGAFNVSRIDPNVTNREDGQSPIFLATVKGELEMMRRLISAKADVNFTNNDGRAPLSLGAEFGQTAAMAVLIEAGAKIDAVDARGRTALHVAVALNRVETAWQLLAWKADPNVQSKTQVCVCLCCARLWGGM
jgi:hypothetical protein